MQAVRKHMLYRPMLPGNPDILFSGSLNIYSSSQDQEHTLVTDVEHLTCFIGGMVGMGAKVFGIDGDLEIAKKLTDGCVWAYESTATGIMPEGSSVLPCISSEKCSWNETAYHHALDPVAATRDEDVAQYVAKKAARDKEEADAKIAAAKQARLDAANPAALESDDVADKSDSLGKASTVHVSDDTGTGSPEKHEPTSLRKRGTPEGKSLGDVDVKSTRELSPAELELQKKLDSTESELDAVSETGYAKEAPILSSNDQALVDPSKPMTHTEFVASRIKQESLPSGYTMIRSRQYILR